METWFSGADTSSLVSWYRMAFRSTSNMVASDLTLKPDLRRETIEWITVGLAKANEWWDLINVAVI